MKSKSRLLYTLFLLFLFACGPADPAERQVPPATVPVATAQATPVATAVATPETRQTSAWTLPDFGDDTKLAAQFDETYSVDDYPADQPLTVHFNQPMNMSHQRPLILSPNVAGQFSWSDDGMHVTFWPETTFKPDAAYTLTVNASLQSQAAERFTSLRRWRIHMQGAPQVKNYSPYANSLDTPAPAVTITFNVPMNQQSVDDAFSIEPPLSYESAWQDAQTLQITVTEPMVFGTNYAFTVAETAVAHDDKPMLLPRTWTYRLKETLKEAKWPESAEHLRPLTLTFNYPIDISQSRNVFKLTPEVAGNWVWSTDRTQVQFRPAGRLLVDTEFTVSFENELVSQDGYALALPHSFSFTTPLAILSAIPDEEDAVPATAVEIRFDRAMDKAAAEAAFKITPATNGRFSWNQNTLIFEPEDGYFQSLTSYRVSIAPTAVSQTGETILKKAYSWRFRTRQFSVLGSFGEGANVQVLDSNGRRAIQYRASFANSVKLNFELHALERSDFLAHFADKVGRYGAENFVESDADPVARWQVTTAPALGDWNYAQETTLPADVPPGLYVLNIDTGLINDQLFIILTPNTITAKMADGQLMAWVTDINGDPVAQTSVELLAKNGRSLGTATTDSSGVAYLDLPPFTGEEEPADTDPFLLLAGQGSTLTLTGLSSVWQNGYGWWNAEPEAGNRYAVYSYTDRPIYRPGHTVYFKAIIREDEDALLDLLPAATAVTARIRDARNNIVQTLDLRTNDFGTVNGEFAIADGAMLGTYKVEFTINGESHRQIFKVEDYRKPDYEVTVSTDATTYINGSQMTVTVDTAYLFGEPVPNAQVEIQRFRLISYYDWQNETPTLSWERVYGNQVTGKTDENGRFTTTIDHQDYYFDDYGYYYGGNTKSIRVGVEATVNDSSNQTVSGFAVVEVYNTAEQLVVDKGSYVQSVDAPVDIDVVVTDINGQPINGRSVSLELGRYNDSTYKYEPIAPAATLITSANGRATYRLTQPEPGYYQIKATAVDSLNNNLRYQTGIYLTAKDTTNWYGNSSSLSIFTADGNTEFVPGETAVLFIESTFDGPALLTFERGTVRREQLVTLTAPLTQVELPIQVTDVPNIYVTVNAWKAQTRTILDENVYYSLSDAYLIRDTINLSVPATEKMLNVTITPNQASYAPGDSAQFTVRVTNYQGVPVSAEVSLALVDDAIFALSEELSGPIYDGFYFERHNLVRTANSLEPQRYLGGGMGGGGGGDGNGLGSPRDDFQDTAVWLPTLTTDFNGEVTVTVELPDNITRWRLTAKATTADTQVGEAVHTVITEKPVLVRPLLPRILTAGDTIALSALVHNYTDSAQTLTMLLSEVVREDGDLRLTIGNIEQTITLQPDEVRLVGWTAVAASAGEIQVRVDAQYANGTLADGVILPLTIQPLAIPQVDTQIGEFTNSLQTTVTIPAEALDMSQVRIELSRSIAGSMLEGLQDLTGYPYGCVEQTMSRALPNAVVGRALNQLGVENPALAAELPKLINASVQRLYGFQHDDGGWGWWFDDNTSDYQTAWVLFGLATTAEGGYEVDPAVLEGAAAYLNGRIPDMDARTKAFALYSMAVAGHGNLQATRILAAKPEALDAFGIAATALALHHQGQTSLARGLIETLEGMAVRENGRVTFPGDKYDGAYDSKTMASTVRNTALALSAFSQIAPGHSLESGMVRYLMGQRRAFGWGTTNETSFAIIGLTDHLLATSFSEEAGSTGYTIQLNGQPLTSGQLHRGEPTTAFTIERSLLQSGDNSLTITQTNGRQLYYVISTRTYIAESEIAAAGNIGITRTYIDQETNKPVTTLQPGQLVRVSLRVQMPAAASYVIIEDKLPAGLEALNESLNTTSHQAQLYEPITFYWDRFGYNQKEVHGDRVTFFVTEMSPGNHMFTYLARVTQGGTVTAMPTEVYAMYDLTVWGRSASSLLTIEE